MIPRISLGSPYIATHISPKSQHHIEYNGRAHRKDRGIHEILPDFTGCNSHAVANSRTNAKGIPLHKAFEFVHTSNIENLNIPANCELFRQVIFVLLPHILLTSKVLLHGIRFRPHQKDIRRNAR
jgi:hypothetical protein